MATGLFGNLFGDRGSVSAALGEDLRHDQGLQFIVRQRKHMAATPLDPTLLRHRAISESVWQRLKHPRHRSVTNFFIDLLAGLVAYCLHPLKPSFPLPA